MTTNPYTTVSITGYNANPPDDDGSQVSSNEIEWAKHKEKLGDPVKTAVETMNTNVNNAFASIVAIIPSGLVWPYAGATAPSGFLLCDGAAVSRTTYSDLFTVIGETFGAGNGSTTFNVPDITGRIIAGKESTATRLTTAGSGIDGDTLGATGGDQNKTIAQTNLPDVNLSSANLTATPNQTTNFQRRTGGSSSVDGGATVAVYSTSAVTDHTLAITMGGTVPLGGSDTPLAVAQPTIILNYIIKT